MPAFAITVDFQIAPGKMDAFRVLVLENAETSVAVEPGCLRFDVLEPATPGATDRVFRYEIYTDRSAFDFHLASAHFKAFDAASRDLVVSRTVETLTATINAKS